MFRARALLRSAGIAALVAGAVLLPLAVHWASGKTLAWFDTLTLYSPQRWMVDEALRAFRLPLWNPYSGAGGPLFADAIHGVLHPVSVVTAWLGTSRSEDLLIGGYVSMAGIGAALLARELGASVLAGVVSGIVYGGSGYVLSMAGNQVFLAGAASLPLCVAGLRRAALRPDAIALLGGVVGVAVLAFSGDAQALMVGGGVTLVLAWEGGGWRGAARAATVGVLGLAVAGVQLVPSAVHLPRTVRSDALWTPPAEVWSFEPWRVPELVLPGLVGGEDPYFDPVFSALSFPSGLPEGAHQFPFSTSVFIGVVPLALAVVGAREGRRGRVLGALVFALLWLALGPRLGASQVMAHVPVWRAFRYTEKLLAPLTLILAVLAGFGLDASTAPARRAWKLTAAAAPLAALAAVGVACWSTSGLSQELEPLVAARLASATWQVGAALLLLVGWLVVRGRIDPVRVRLALALLVWAGMVAASPAALRPGSPKARLQPEGPPLDYGDPATRIVTPATVARLPHRPGADRSDEFARDFAAVGHPAYNVRFRLSSLSEYAAMAPPRLALLHSYFGERWPILARRYAATHLFLDPALKREDPALYGAVTVGGARVGTALGGDELWSIPHREWASFAPEVRAAPDWTSAALALGREVGEPSPAVIVEAAGQFRSGPGRIISQERGLDFVRVEGESARDSTLVIADAWWPGWEATVDGDHVTVFAADGLIRAVRWPAGRHLLEMRYRPPEVRTGAITSLLGLLTTALGAWLLHRRRASPEGGAAGAGEALSDRQ